MRHLFLSLFCLYVVPCIGQTTFPHNWTLRVNATALIDVITFPTVQASLEKSIGSRFSIGAEAGIQVYPGSFDIDTQFVKTRGHKLIIEGRFYTLIPHNKVKGNAMEGIYVALQAFRYRNQYNAEKRYAIATNTLYLPRIDAFSATKTKIGGRFVMGLQIKVAPRWFADFYGGVGAESRVIVDDNREFDPKFDAIEECDLPCFEDYESSQIVHSFCFGLRLGYSF